MTGSIKAVTGTTMNDETQAAPTPPSPWVCRFSALIPEGGRVLDLACGRGRHSRYLAEKGFRVTAVDQDEAVLAALAGVPGITPLCADLEDKAWPLGVEQFSGIIITNYLWRPLVPMVLASLEVGGVLIQETFMVGNEYFGRPRSPAYLLRPGELLEVARQRLTVVAFEQGEVAQPRQSVIQRLCAVRGQVGKLPE